MLDFLFKYTPLAYFAQSLWRDEAFSYLLAKKNVIEILFLTARDFNPPLYYLVLHLWIKIFNQSEIALRSLSLLFFYATIYVVDHYLTDVLHIKSRWRFLYLLLFLLNPFLNYYASEARMYTMFAFFGTLSFYAFIQKKYRLHIVASVLGLYTHYFMAFVLLTQLVYLLMNRLRSGNKLIINSFYKIGLWFLPWVLFLLIRKPPVMSNFWVSAPTLNTILETPLVVLTGYDQGVTLQNYSRLPLTILVCFVIAIAIMQYRYIRDEKKYHILYLLFWSFLPSIFALILSLWKPLFLPRYFIFSSIGLTLLLVYTLEHSKPATRIGVFALFLILITHYNVAQATSRLKANLKRVIGEIKTTADPNDVVYVDTELNFHTAQYYFDPTRVYIYQKSYDDIPAYVGKVLIPQDHIASSLPVFPKKAFVIHDDLTYDVQSIY